MVNLSTQVLLMLFIAAGQLACSTHYNVSSNLDPENFRQHFAASQVEIYQNDQSLGDNYRFVGLVEGQDCQIKTHHAPPSPIIARTRARKQAYAQKANGIIFSPCVAIDAPQCEALLVCYARAYQVVED
jgi:RcsF protein